MENGVTLIDPKTTYIGIDVEIGKDTIIYPNNILEGNTKIGSNCTLYQNSRIVDSVIGDEVDIQSSVILNSNIGDNTTVGPFAYIRPETTIGKHARIGDFVEIKKSTIEKLFNEHIENKNAATVLTSMVEDPTGYGRIVRDSNNEVLKIVEHKDCNEEELKIKEMNTAIYCFDIELLVSSLSKINNNNNQGEYYLTDVI